MKFNFPTMEENQETSEITRTTVYEVNMGEKRANPTAALETDVSESSSNAIITASAISTYPLTKKGYTIGASSSSSRVRPPPPFLQKVYDIVKKSETDPIISWNSTGTSFIVWDPHKFAAEILGKYFRHNNFSSFICQLNTYGFKKINWDRLEFQNEWFQKGKKSWLKNIKRRNQCTMEHIRPMQNVGGSTLFEKQKRLEHLRHEHDAWKVEMLKHKKMQEDLQEEMTTLEQQAQFTTSKQQKILKYMVQELLMSKKKQTTNPAKEKRSDGQQSIGISYLQNEEEISYKSQEKPANVQLDMKKACSDVDLGTTNKEKEKCSVVGTTFSDYYIADYILKEKQLMDDFNYENMSKEERTKLQSNVVIALEDLIAGPADWTEFAKELGHKARNNC